MAPFGVLHICMGNICRSPMAERLFAAAVREIAGERADELVYSASAGTGGWHEGEPMNPPAARQLRARGGDDTGFTARRLRAEHIDTADLVLTATADQVEYIVSLRPDAAGRTFVLGEVGRLLTAVDLATLPPAALRPQAVSARGAALVQALHAARGGRGPEPGDDVEDPWGRGDGHFSRVADVIDRAVRPLAAALLLQRAGAPSRTRVA
ncbi:MAG TPA: phosphotyrosine protein phosphatase [Micromonosporaceae bacterium]|nr:phosphotyrosine protein phosphatase [Micromonosporaceae bacterium]